MQGSYWIQQGTALSGRGQTDGEAIAAVGHEAKTRHAAFAANRVAELLATTIDLRHAGRVFALSHPACQVMRRRQGRVAKEVDWRVEMRAAARVRAMPAVRTAGQCRDRAIERATDCYEAS